MGISLPSRLSRISGLSNSVIGFAESPRRFIEIGTPISEQYGFIQKLIKNMTENDGGRGDFGFNFYGYSSSSSLSVQEQLSVDNVLGQYFFPPLLDSTDLFLNEVEAELDLGGDLKKAKIEYSSIPKGMFDFSKASKGLIRPVEYYSYDLDALISPDDVYHREINEKRVFFAKKNNEEYVLEPRQEGTTEMLKAFPDKLEKVLLPKLNIFVPQTITGEKVVKYRDKRIRFTSTEKKVYAYRKRLGGGLAPFVDLYINISGSWQTTSEGRFLKALPSILIARVLQSAGVRTRIWSGEFSSDNSMSKLNIVPSLLKEYGDPLDLNKLGVIVSDSRFFRALNSNALGGYLRYLSDFWRKEDSRVPELTSFSWGSGYPLNEEACASIMPYIRNAFFEYEKRGLVKPTQAMKKLMIYLPSPFDGTESYMEYFDQNNNPISLQDTTLEVVGGEAIYKYNGEPIVAKPIESIKERVKESFYRGIDYISLILSKNPRGVVSGIRKRIIDKLIKDGFSTTEADDRADRYLSQTLWGDVFKNITYTVNDEDNPNILQKAYMSSPQEIEEGKEQRRKLLAIINEQIKNTSLQASITT